MKGEMKRMTRATLRWGEGVNCQPSALQTVYKICVARREKNLDRQPENAVLDVFLMNVLVPKSAVRSDVNYSECHL